MSSNCRFCHTMVAILPIQALYSRRPYNKRKLWMLALCSFQARIRPERSSYTFTPFGITWTLLVSGIGTTFTPARLECEPCFARHGFEIVALSHLFFLSHFFERRKVLL